MKKVFKSNSRIAMLSGALLTVFSSMALGEPYTGWSNYQDYVMNPRYGDYDQRGEISGVDPIDKRQLRGVRQCHKPCRPAVRQGRQPQCGLSLPGRAMGCDGSTGGDLGVGGYGVFRIDLARHQDVLGERRRAGGVERAAVFTTGNGFVGVWHLPRPVTAK